MVEALDQLPFMPKENIGWSKIDFTKQSESSSDMPDIEESSFHILHEEACMNKADFYKDPTTGYSVYTEYAIKKRGKCCGSGCRHCPYNHENMKDKTKYIQQPAFIYDGETNEKSTIFAPLSLIPPQAHIKVLFFSGGKDSFLAIRKLVKERQTSPPRFHLILLTTFDAESRIIAHQEIPIDAVLRQGQHLGIPLLAIPLRRGSGETYLSRIERGVDAIHQRVKDIQQLTLVFGDLHLDHIKEWRDKELKQYSLEYPLWKVPYVDLIQDLEDSEVSVVLSAVTVDNDMLKIGMPFTRKLMEDLSDMGFDAFGENGEFHSLAQVWTVSREKALGVPYDRFD